MFVLLHGTPEWAHASPLLTPTPYPFCLQVCRGWFARIRPLLLRTAAAAHLHELAAYHGLRRLHDLQRHLQALLPAAASGESAAGVQGSTGTGAASSSMGAAAGAPAAASNPAEGEAASPDVAGALAAAAPPLLQRRTSSITSEGAGANPSAALLAATRGSPDPTLRQQRQQQRQAGGPADASQQAGRQLSHQQLQQAAAKVADAAAAVAAALCAMGDAQGVAGLQAYCRQAFLPLLRQWHQLQHQPASAEAGTDDDAAAAAAAAGAAWDWLSAVECQAAGRYEAAIQHYSQVYSTADAAALQCVPGSALARLAADAYVALGDGEGLQLSLQVRVVTAPPSFQLLLPVPVSFGMPAPSNPYGCLPARPPADQAG